MLVYIPRFSRLPNTLEQLLLRLDGYLIVQFKVKGVQVLSTTPNFIYYQQVSFIWWTARAIDSC